MKRNILFTLLFVFVAPFFLTAKEEKSEGYKASTVSDFLSTKYKWEEQKEEPVSEEVVNDTPLKNVDQKLAERQTIIEGRLQPTLDIDDPAKAIPPDEQGLDTVELKEYQVSELYSPLMRMSEMKDLETLDPASGGAYLSEEYFTEFENRFLNAYKIPLIGKSQEQLAKERYQLQQYQEFLGEISGTIDGMETLNPQYAKELNKELLDTQIQYNTNNKREDFRYTGPDAKF